ncbi:hypothetical protein ME5_01095 [Bartonella tamiae Th239]|uniref:Segregation and condensation protein A n=2 Tax=Bartonella tamiae TaxID=373638 RepID=J0R4U8_9HYPH|nr:hypothetical protein ME5_01095 [Bartonella tamiae Th239]
MGLNYKKMSKHSAQKAMDKLWTHTENYQKEDHGIHEPSFIVDVQGFEGPMDLLLHLARNQKVDLERISILALVEQYLNFIDQAHLSRLEIAADYLVMAAWLVYLKSRLLMPKTKSDEEESGEELAQLLQFRLKRLEAMREAAVALFNCNQLGRDVFKRAHPETLVLDKKKRFETSLYELLTAYVGLRQRQSATHVEVAKRTVWSLKMAREILERLIDAPMNWTILDRYLSQYIPSQKEKRTALASAFAASLEMVKEGQINMQQEKPFAPLYLRVASKIKSHSSQISFEKATMVHNEKE